MTFAYTTGYPLTVYRGAQLLDEHAPGWEERIDLHTLDLSDGCHCILGQLYDGDGEGYTRGLVTLGIGGSGARYGFSVWGRQRWDDLTAWWRELIHERRAEKAA